MNMEILVKAQSDSLYREIKSKTRHQKLYDARSNEQVDIEGSSMWLKHGNNRAQGEARLCYLQDRNLFGEKVGKCPHCTERLKTVDHLATQCDRMLYHDYMKRHNEVVRCIHLYMCNKIRPSEKEETEKPLGAGDSLKSGCHNQY